MLDFSLLKNSPVLIMLVMQNVFGMLGFYTPFVYTVAAATAKVGREGRNVGIRVGSSLEFVFGIK